MSPAGPSRALVLAAALVAHAAGVPEARGDERARGERRGVAWDPRWRSAGAVDYALIATLGGVALGAYAVSGGEPRWVGRNGFDDAGQRAFRLDAPGGRRSARLASNLLYYGLGAYPIVVDSLLFAGLVHGKADVAFQTLVVSAEGLLANAAATTLAQGLARRARPHAEHCADPARRNEACSHPQASKSFWAGHVSTAFTGATLTCVTHARLPLLGGGTAEVLACALPLLGATATGYLRMAGDKHWASDVAIGAGVGTIAGLVLPLSLRYGWSSRGESTALRGLRLAPFGGRGVAGIRARGSF